MMGLLNVGSRVFNSRASTVGAVGLGLGIALNKADMGTWAMDYTEDALLGTTNADEAFTGSQQSLTAPFRMAAMDAMANVPRTFAQGFNMLSMGNMPVMPRAHASPLRYMSDMTGAYRKAGEGSPMSTGELGMRAGNRRYNQTPNQAVDGSMVFGMYNLRR